jgi:hypothetical protein
VTTSWSAGAHQWPLAGPPPPTGSKEEGNRAHAVLLGPSAGPILAALWSHTLATPEDAPPSKPRGSSSLHLHGHMHAFGEAEIDGRRVISLDRDTFPGNAGLLDMTTLTFNRLPHDSIGY